MKSNTRIYLAAPAALLLACIVIYAQTPAKAPEDSGGAPPAGLPGAPPAAQNGSSGTITVRAVPASPGGAPIPDAALSPPSTITGSASLEELPAPGSGEPPAPAPAPDSALPPPVAAPQAILNGSGTIELRAGGLRPPPIQDAWIVRPGDTLIGIQRQTGIPVATLMRLNGLTETSAPLRVGQTLKTTGSIEGPRQFSTVGGADRDPRAKALPGREARIIESSADVLPPPSGQDIIRETKLKVLQRHYESALSDTMEMERNLITATAEQKEELSGKVKLLREFVTKLEAAIEKLGPPAHRTNATETRLLPAPDGSGGGAAFPGRHPDARPGPHPDARPVDPADASPLHDSNLPPQPPQPLPRSR